MTDIYSDDGFLIDVAEAGMGPPVLLVHGFPLDRRMWHEQVGVLATRHRVIAPDLRGFGDSRGVLGPVTMGRYADDLLAVLDALGVDEPVALCGLSMGGYIAFEFWRRHAVRVGSLMLCDTRAGGDTPEAAAKRIDTADRVLAAGVEGLADEMLPKLLAPSSLHGRLHVVDRLREMMISCDPAAVSAALRAMADRSDSAATLPQIDVPTLILVGEEDAITPPAESKKMAEAIPGAEMVIVPDAGHLAPMETPEAVNDALLNFLALGARR